MWLKSLLLQKLQNWKRKIQIDLRFSFMVYPLIVNDLLTDPKGTKYAFPESFKEATANVFKRQINTFESKQPGNGFHQLGDPAFSMTSAATKDIKHRSYV